MGLGLVYLGADNMQEEFEITLQTWLASEAGHIKRETSRDIDRAI